MKRWAFGLLLFGGVLCAVGLFVTRPQQLPADALAGITPDAANGALVFAAMGCASCHMAPESEDQTRLSGGKSFKTDFGTFYAPNISTDVALGIGGWTDLEIANAIMKGTSPNAQHYFPVFPYGSYVRADLADVVDLIAHLRSLPPDQTPSLPHDVAFPFNIRASLGGWKMLFLRPSWVVTGTLTTEETRGRELVEALGHCGECHTPRNALGGMKWDAWLAGASIPGSKGRTPDIRAETLQWSANDIVAYLKTGLTPDYDSAGGEMVEVIANTSQLPESDLKAIAAYLLLAPKN
ncbi:cytochrome c [Aliiroseovarius sp. S1339]|uniref:cytochrome c n=1 Tax=Aliiroseovarius sp. S1339 TaxID=2936990 RepID=UPI0020BFF2D9|nr:cytochrome c [Aliiroseovarius sp. S1339]MCK8465360.1 cytochrome c [Aliiroseovarius sp. S1339]